MTQPRQLPDTTPRIVDRFFPPFGAVFGLALSLFLMTPSELPMARPPVFFGGCLVGLLVPRILRRHHYRVLGFVPWTTTAAVVVAVIAEIGTGWSPLMIGLFTLSQGIAVGSLLRYRDRFRVHLRRFLLWSALGALVGIVLIAAFIAAGATVEWISAYRAALVALAVAIAITAWLTLFRPLVETTVEVPMRVMYRITVAGPGRDAIPPQGPFIVIANHGSWFDPLMVAMNITRPVVPLMTAGFYDLPVLRWLMIRIFRTIRVPEKTVRREAPEVQEAVSALDVGHCVVVFPEGYLRRKEEPVLRRFGQGVWHLLKARPQTPVLACWLEGVWGSYFSHHGGPPTKNKRFDIRRPVRLGMAAPEHVPEEVLADPMQTRIYLMNRVLAARRHLGLPDVPTFEIEKTGPREETEGATTDDS